jgi:hypothetical protein
MKQLMHVAIIAVVTLLLLPTAQAEDLARIYVYVQMEAPQRSWFPIWCDGTEIAEIKQGRFFAVTIAPGRHILSDEKGVPVAVVAGPGTELFVRLDWRMQVGGPPISVLQVVPGSTARGDMTYLRYIDADKVLSKLVPKKDPRQPPHLMRRSKADDE